MTTDQERAELEKALKSEQEQMATLDPACTAWLDAAKAIHRFSNELQGRHICNATWFLDGGRASEQCTNVADEANVCVECGEARCDEHDSDLAFDEVDGRVLCGDCQEARGI